MNKKNQERFTFSVATILFAIAANQLFCTISAVPLFDRPDPLLSFSIRQVFYLIAGLELALSAFLLLSQNLKIKLVLIAWLAANLLVYRAGLSWENAPNYFSCLGNLTDKFPIPPRILHSIMLLSLGYFLSGSCLFIMLDWLSRHRSNHADKIIANIKNEVEPPNP
jgi:hypothetical protein